MPRPSCVRSRPSRSCAASRSKTTSGSRISSTGAAMRIFLQATSSSTRPMIKKRGSGKKRETRWTGYKVHITETCEEDAPHLITHVATTAATTTDEAMTETIHTELSRASLTPRQHLLDTGSITAPILVSSRQQYGIEVIGPARGDVKWRANTEQSIDASQFLIDWERQQAICPEGHSSISWTPAIDHRTNEVIKIKFSTKDCGRCPRQVHCIRSAKTYKRRTITIRPQAQHEALQAARRRQQTPAFASQYALQEGIEATISEAGARLWYSPLPLYPPWPTHSNRIPRSGLPNPRPPPLPPPLPPTPLTP